MEQLSTRDTVWGPYVPSGARQQQTSAARDTQPVEAPESRLGPLDLRKLQDGQYFVSRPENNAGSFTVVTRTNPWFYGNFLPAVAVGGWAIKRGRPGSLSGFQLGALGTGLGLLIDMWTGASTRQHVTTVTPLPPRRIASIPNQLDAKGETGPPLPRPIVVATREASLPAPTADSLRQAFFARLETALAPCSGVGRAISDAEGGLPREAAIFRFDDSTEALLRARVDSTRARILPQCEAISPFTRQLLAMRSLGDTVVSAQKRRGDAGPVYFGFADSQNVPSSTRKRLINLARYLRDHPLGEFLEITLVGTADPSGSAEFNRALGAARARRVRALLIAAGLNARYEIISAGEDPAYLVTAAAGRATPEARANRRVQFLFGIGAR